MSQIINGYFTSDGNARTLPIVSDFDSFKIYIQGNSSGDNWNSVANPGVLKWASWFTGMAAGTGLGVYNTAGAATDQATFIASNGFTKLDQSNPPTFPVLTISTVSQGNPAVVTTTGNHNLSTGDLVRMWNVTGQQQISSMLFSVTVTGATTFTIPINTSGFANAGSGGSVRKVFPGPEQPYDLFVTGISKASSAVVTTSTNHGLSVGAIVKMTVPAAFGMTEMNGLSGTITAVTATTFTLNIDSSGFTTFAFPLTSQTPFTFAQATPYAESATILTNAQRNIWVRGMYLGTSVCGPNGALVLWEATKAIAVNPS